MSKAEELAKKITQYHRFGYETEDQAKLRRIEQHKEAAAHLRALEANRQMLGKVLTMVRDTLPHIDGNASSVHSMLRDINAALEQAKELT